MHIVIDSNILFAALIKDSSTRKLILEYENLFLFPEIIFEEVEKYKSNLLEKSGMDEKEFDKLLGLILKKVMIIPTEMLNQFYNESEELANKVESPEDQLFFACALAYPSSVIRSNDKKLIKQTKIKIITTQEMISLI
ncbi:MAG: PIN domain-containing protein [Candidatus Nanoarchaeia archaeon]|nr:PIN domain-containing protein [Candidatus Nanoarchaeia archaeon]